jgi:uncharacterized membrane protein YeiH
VAFGLKHHRAFGISDLESSVHTLVLMLDLVGTFIFALSGAMAAMTHRLDLFGVLTLSFAAGNAGGITRDVMIGATPPSAIDDWRYIAVSLTAGVITFRWASILHRLRSPVLILDAGGLGLFAVSGATKALTFHLDPVAAMLLGMLSGIGGGMLRDVLVSEIPSVLREDFYAGAALAGAAVVVAGHGLQFSATATAVAGAALCVGLRIVSIRRGWQLPKSPLSARSTADAPPGVRSNTP